MATLSKNEDTARFIKRGSLWSLCIGAILLIGVIIFVITHLEETKSLLLIIKGADPLLLGLAILAQIGTYFLAGAVWHMIAKSAKYHLTSKSVIYLAFAQSSVNQLIPAGGMAGNLIIVRAMKRLGLPNALAIEVFFIDTLAFYISFTVVTFVALIILSLHDNITPIIFSLAVGFFIFELFIIGIIWAAANHKRIMLPRWIKKGRIMSRVLVAIEHISSERIFSLKLLFQTSLLRLGIFVLDALTLYIIMQAIGVEDTLSTSFVAFVIASVAGTITLLPGGIGGFEAGAITTLVLLGTPIAGAIAGTLLLRLLTLWIPMVPGLIIAREDFGLSDENKKTGEVV